LTCVDTTKQDNSHAALTQHASSEIVNLCSQNE